MARPGADETREHAVVIGASMGGLVAAAALAQHYQRVTVLERDTLPDGPRNRRGVPQGRHAHGLQPGGVQALDTLLPGIFDELVADGAPFGDLSSDCSWMVGGNHFARGQAGVRGIGVTRPFLEHHVRSRVAALQGVTIRDGVEALRLTADDPHRVDGIEIGPIGGGPTERISANLVLDATGKISKLPQWLSALGYPAPAEERVHCKMAYLTRRWQLADPAARDLVTVITPAETPHFAVMLAQEDGSHIVTLGGLLDSGPARTDEAYLAFAANLPNTAIAEALVDATPLTDLQPAHFPASCRRRYDKLRSFPAGLLALGDSIAAFNPMYGQGMSVAALQAVALREQLADGPLDARKFFRRAHRIADVAWKIATGGDLRFDAVDGRRTTSGKIMNRYLDKLTQGARTDPALSRQFLLVASFMQGPESLFKPAIVRRVLASARSARRQAAREPAGNQPIANRPVSSQQVGTSLVDSPSAGQPVGSQPVGSQPVGSPSAGQEDTSTSRST
jgi:2-polyprenyl-6-methoxyphenol hydroxylase-like FAD-dependent oxidoreductase